MDAKITGDVISAAKFNPIILCTGFPKQIDDLRTVLQFPNASRNLTTNFLDSDFSQCKEDHASALK